ncbi:MAG: lipid-A-disaccharide synthase N-terminal domain-containing protein [Parachlamydiaceae bacterium]|nr:lipid-A-disaccharide synthase N-terminal domain-containing protein [Parachlamydiaceae bacterium]
MSEGWRELLYPLGFLSALAFGGRGILQWVTSEVQQKSVVTRAFWRLSLVGNVLLMLHSFLQLQFHVCIIQAGNTVISWRNLNLMQPVSQQIPLRNVLLLFVGAAAVVVSGFMLQGYLFGSGEIEWFRLPAPTWEEARYINPLWHVVGFAAMILFSGRFWVQWWDAEQERSSVLGPAFWWLSLTGGILTLVYFVRIDDPVNIIGPAFGLIPYIRNLMLIYRKRPQTVGLT